MSTKFALVDQSVKGEGGHHLEYAVRVLEAAEKQGFEPVLGAGVKFTGGSSPAYPSFSVFRYSFWENLHRKGGLARLFLAYATFRKERREAAQQRKVRRKYASEYTRTGLDKHRSLEVETLRDPLMEVFASDLSPLPSKRGALVRHRYVHHYKEKARSTYWRMVAAYGRLPRLIHVPIHLFRRITGGLFRFSLRQSKRLAKLAILAVAAPFCAVALPFIMGPAHRPAFRQDLQTFMRKARLKPGDIVFVPTLGETEMLALADLCARNPLARKIRWRLLFRRDLFSGRSIHHGSQNNDVSVRRFRLALEETKRKLAGTDVRFYTDTDPLTDQYNHPKIFPFETLPIPVGAEFMPSRKPGNERPLIAGYLGDARDEKGYPLLADAVNHIYQSHIASGDVRLMAQSNYNLEAGEPGSIAAKLSLMALPPQARDLPEGPFSSAEYAALFNEADILLVPYNAEAYASRSSGVFAEALAAGRPTLVTRGSWMATILEPYKQAYLKHLEGLLPPVSPFLADTRKNTIENRRMLSRPTLGDIGKITAIGTHSHVLIRLDFPRIDKDMHVTATVDFYDIYDRRVEQASQTAWLNSPSLRFLIPVPDKTSYATITVVPLDGATKAVPDRTIVRAVNLPRGVPHSFGGCIVDPNAEQVAGGLRELVDNFEIYQKMAMMISTQWAPYCMAETLIAGLDDSASIPHSPEHDAETLVEEFFKEWDHTLKSRKPPGQVRSRSNA